MRFVHTADNHLDTPLGSLPPHKAIIRRDMRLSSFSKIIDYTIKNADMLLISGDLFDSPNPPRSVLSFCRKEFERLGDIPVFIALGNHDFGETNYNFPGNVRIFSPFMEKITYKDCTITGASFSSSSADFAASIPPSDNSFQKNILCIHGDIFTKSDYNPLNKDILATYGYNYIALGHIHNYAQYKNMVYPGCHDGSGFDETGEKGFIYGEILPDKLNLRFVPSSTLIYQKESFDISQFTSSKSIADALMEIFPDGIYKFILTGTPSDNFSPNLDVIESYISQKFFHATLEDNTSSHSDVSDGMLYKLLSEYITSHADGDIAHLALRYSINALKGDVDA